MKKIIKVLTSVFKNRKRVAQKARNTRPINYSLYTASDLQVLRWEKARGR